MSHNSSTAYHYMAVQAARGAGHNIHPHVDPTWLQSVQPSESVTDRRNDRCVLQAQSRARNLGQYKSAKYSGNIWRGSLVENEAAGAQSPPRGQPLPLEIQPETLNARTMRQMSQEAYGGGR